MERMVKANLAEATHVPDISAAARGLREDCPRDDKSLGDFFYKMGIEHNKKKERKLERKKREILADEGVLGKPEISEAARRSRDPCKGDEVGIYLYKRGQAFQAQRARKLTKKEKEVRADEDATFKPHITEKTRRLADACDARQEGMTGNQWKRVGKHGGGSGMSAPEARLYDRGLMFEWSKERKAEKARAELQQKEMEEVTAQPGINDRSRKLVKRSMSRKKRAQSQPFSRLEAGDDTPRRADLRTSMFLRSYSPSPPRDGANAALERAYLFDDWDPHDHMSPLRVPAPKQKADGYYDDDLLAPPSLERIIDNLRLKQDMRKLGV
eukprot:gene13490-20785_t